MQDTQEKRDMDLIHGLGRSPGGGNGYPLQYSCLKNSKDRGARQATCPWVCKESDTTEWLSVHTHTHTHTYQCNWSPWRSMKQDEYLKLLSTNSHLLLVGMWEASVIVAIIKKFSLEPQWKTFLPEWLKLKRLTIPDEGKVVKLLAFSYLVDTSFATLIWKTV